MDVLSPHIRRRIDEKLRRLQAYRPLNTSVLKKLREQMEVEMTYNSNAIEGNSLTLRETLLVLEEGITIKGKSLKDHLEAKDHKDAMDFLYTLTHKKNVRLTESIIRQFHQLVMRETEREWAGRYRNGSVRIAGTTFVPPHASDVPKRMRDLIQWHNKQRRTLHPVELAARVHHMLVAIHPFFDGNGRTGRLIMNIVLMQAGFPLAIILKNDRSKYYRTLQQADGGNYTSLTLFVAQAVERSLDLYLEACDVQEERLLTLQEAAKGTSYSAKYLNLLARSGRLAAHKRGRIWYTTKQAIAEYREGRLRQR